MFNDRNNESGNFGKIKRTPVYIKAEELLTLSKHIAAVVSKDDVEYLSELEGAILENHADWLMESAKTIPVRIIAAQTMELYDIKMEHATMIRKAALEMQAHCRGLELYGFPDIEYLVLLRDDIEIFRVLFAEWVKTFDPWHYNIDRWGLFNPPGINYDDTDPDDDLP